MKIENPETKIPYELGVKRLYMPHIITGKCPNCGADFEYPCDIAPIMYPSINQKFKFLISHELDDDEECEFEINVKLSLDLEII